MLDPKQLETLSAVAETGGFDKAAKSCFSPNPRSPSASANWKNNWASRC